ncbi:MAG: type II secretion system F family protein [Bdellovibrionales bacterium]|nr:type II secretion system F family protein [Bdellovibrionales bacterium]
MSRIQQQLRFFKAMSELLDAGRSLSSAIETAQGTITDSEVRSQIMQIYNQVVESSGEWLQLSSFNLTGPQIFNELFLLGIQRSFLPEFNLHVLLLKEVLGDDDLVQSTSQVVPVLGILLKCEVPLFRAFDLLRSDTESVEIRQFAGEVMTGVEKGRPLFLAMSKRPDFISEDELKLIEVGEQDGTLVEKMLEIYDLRSK